jgi:hypothetical protein
MENNTYFGDHRIIIPGVVLDNQDPLMIGRIRVLPKTENELQAYPEDWSKEKEWTIQDPFVFLPLIPYYISQIPEIDEYVHIMYATKQETKDATKFYIQGPLSRPWNNSFENYRNAESVLANGDNLQKAYTIKNKTTGEIENKYKGLYPEPGDNAILGRGSTDIVLKKDDVLIRAGKFNSLNTSEVPTKNENRSFIQLSNYDFTLKENGSKIIQYTEYVDIYVSRYLEWSLENITFTSSGSSIDGYIRLNTVKQADNTLASKFEVLEITGSTLNTTPIESSQLNFSGANTNDVINLINQYIQGVNGTYNDKSYVQISGSTILTTNNIFRYPKNGSIIDQFPLYFGPNPKTNNLKNDDDGDIFSIFTEIYNNVKFNEVDNVFGSGILWSKNQLGLQTSDGIEEIIAFKNEQEQTTYNALGGDYLYLLSHKTQKPNFDKINLKNTLYGITQDQFTNEIEPKTSSLVRGEELLELLEKVIEFLSNHTHPFPGIHPIREPDKSVKMSEIKTLIEQAQNTILNQNIRIN